MGHWPPRQESSQPPVTVIDTQQQQRHPLASALPGSWHEISNQFEESVGKPSREALHKFFYPPSPIPHYSSSSHRRHRSSCASSNSHIGAGGGTTGKAQRENLKTNSAVINNEQESCDSSVAEKTYREQEQQASEAPPVFENDSDESTECTREQRQLQRSQQDTTTPPPFSGQEPEQQLQPQTTLVQTRSTASLGSLSIDSISPQPPTTFQQSFDVQEDEDRKYVEKFWTIYDDIIILSLFTQLGVIARLGASTWFTFFDGGVFRADSPLFTVLPLNCLSCFLLGLLGSGERLMEMITTRFTPRNLQQAIVQQQPQRNDHDNNDDDNYKDGYDRDEDDDNHDPNDGLEEGEQQQRGDLRPKPRRRRRPKRSRINEKPFHTWEPPLHWHDDLREVQLLALERRIRASKCLILFPVNKEDADVMEHYFGDGYKASAQREMQEHQKSNNPSLSSPLGNNSRRRRRFGRKKYNATDLADVDDMNNFPSCTGSGIYEYDEYEYNDDDDRNGDDLSGGYEVDEAADDGRFRFDLKLTESTEKPRQNGCEPGATQTADSTSNVPAQTSLSSIHKLMKRESREVSDSLNNCQQSDTTHAAAQSALGVHIHSGIAALGLSQPTQALSDFGTEGGPQISTEPTPAAISGLTSIVDADHSLGTASGGEEVDPQLEQIISNVQANVSENINRIRRINVAGGWDVGSTPEAMSDDLMLGLRDGFCGALSSFSSWNSSMLNLLREGQIGEAFIGYLLGLQLPIVAYRFGQQVAVYYFVWRCRREARREERKGGYGIRLKMDDEDDDEGSSGVSRGRVNSSSGIDSVDECFEDELSRAKSADSTCEEAMAEGETPSVRAICTAMYLMALVTQFTSLSFFTDTSDQQLALSLLFSPVGTLARWRLSRFNVWRPGFPVGTFACNILACALSGSLGSLLAGNPGPKERILLQSFVSGFGGTLSSLATFVVEILAGIDPILFRFDGVIYAVCSIGWALIVGFIFSASVDWADETT